ncbi:MAG: type II toxin-antitoxin system VapC family toxin [bacterium]
MQLLLDTHIWIWSVSDPDRLSAKVRRALEAPDTDLWLSPISVWEAMLLFQRGRLITNGDPASVVDEMLRAVPQRAAPLTHAVAVASCLLELPHRDPADRMIAATAKVHGLTLVTADKRLLASREYATLPNVERRRVATGGRSRKK